MKKLTIYQILSKQTKQLDYLSLRFEGGTMQHYYAKIWFRSHFGMFLRQQLLLQVIRSDRLDGRYLQKSIIYNTDQTCINSVLC